MPPACPPHAPLETCSSSSHFPTRGQAKGTRNAPEASHVSPLNSRKGSLPSKPVLSQSHRLSLTGFVCDPLHDGRGSSCLDMSPGASHRRRQSGAAGQPGLGTLTQQVLCGLTCAPQARLDLDARVLLLHGARQLQVGRLKAAGFTRETTPGGRLGFGAGTARGPALLRTGTSPAGAAHQYSTTMWTPLPGSSSPGWGAADAGPASPLIAAGSAPAAASGCDVTPRAREGAGPRGACGRPLQAAAAAAARV